MPVEYSAVITAAGAGSRYGGIKQLADKVGGKSVLCHSIDRFDLDEECLEIILVVSPAVREWIAGDPLTFASPKMKVVDGGATRAESVATGVRTATGSIVVIQDGNRPNTSEALLEKVKSAVQPERGSAPGLPLGSGAAYVTAIGDDSGTNGSQPPADDLFGGGKSDSRVGDVTKHAPAGGLYALQTPQAYNRETFLKALDDAGDDLTGYLDDSAVYIAAGFKVAVVAGHPSNIRVTSADDYHLLLKVMGGGQKKRKDKYGGLGW